MKLNRILFAALLNLNSIIYGGSNVTIWEWTSLPMLTM